MVYILPMGFWLVLGAALRATGESGLSGAGLALMALGAGGIAVGLVVRAAVAGRRAAPRPPAGARWARSRSF